MKYVILIILGLILSSNFIIAQNFAPLGAQWTYKTWCPAGGEISKVTVIGDTIINNKYCTIIHRTLKGNQIKGSELILHENNDRIYFFENDFKLLYDFSKSLNIGDTIVYYVPSNINTYYFSCGWFLDTINPFLFIISKIDSVLTIDGKYLKKWESYLPNSPYFHKIIENIGDIGGFIGNNCILLGGVPSRLLCYNNGTIDYRSEIAQDCMATALENLIPDEVLISPIPTKRELVIKLNNGKKINKWILFNPQGLRLISQSTIPSKEIHIDLQNLHEGIYFLQIIMDDTSMIIKKIYKN